MDAVTGRHRQRGLRGLITAGVLIALGVGFLSGVGTGLFVSGGEGDDESASTASATATSATSAPSSMTVPSSASPQDQLPQATGAPAPADPVPPGPQGSNAYLTRLAENGLPVDEHGDVILVLGRVVCEAPPAERGNPATADRVAAIAGDLLTREQVLQLVPLAAQELCGT